MGSPGPSEEGLRWRPWPCKACRGGFTPLGYLRRRLRTGPSIFGAIEESVTYDVKGLREWTEGCHHHGYMEMPLRQIAEGSEHRVYLDAANARVFKATRPGIFGESYYIRDNKVFQKNCRPLEYLARLHFWKNVFGSAPEALGITALGQIVSSHEFITGELPTQNEVDLFLQDAGFVAIKQKYWLWRKIYRPDRVSRPRLIIELGDARDENFVKSSSGIVPIDIRLWGIHSYQ